MSRAIYYHYYKLKISVNQIAKRCGNSNFKCIIRTKKITTILRVILRHTKCLNNLLPMMTNGKVTDKLF